MDEKKIGANVAQARANKKISQQDLADEMRSRGWKWSQSTVWSIEKGERPLRLAEAEDLHEALGLNSVEALLAGKFGSLLAALLLGTSESADENLAIAVTRSVREHVRLASKVQKLLEEDQIDPELAARAAEHLQWTALNLAEDVYMAERHSVEREFADSSAVRDLMMAWDQSEVEVIEQIIAARSRREPGWTWPEHERDSDGEHPETS